MNFSAFHRSFPQRNFAFPRGTLLRQRLYEERDFGNIQPPCVSDPALALLQQSYPSSVCMINRPLCGLLEPTIGQCGNGRCGYELGERRPAGGWIEIGYLLPLYAEPRRTTHGGNRQCHCKKFNQPIRTQTLQRPSRFQNNCNNDAPYDQYDNFHEEDCPFSYNETECQNRECGPRRYKLYMRIDPDRLGQQCFYTSARRGDHNYNNCKYLQFGVAEEGLFNSTIMILTRNYIADCNSFSNSGTRCIQDGDVLFIPGERNRKFRVTLYDTNIYDGYCSQC